MEKTPESKLAMPALVTVVFAVAFAMCYVFDYTPDSANVPKDADGFIKEITKEVVVYRTAGILMWLAITWLAIRLMDVFFWQRAVPKRTGTVAPKLLVELVRVLFFVAMVLIIIAFVFQQPISGLLVSSGAVGIVLGFALQHMILDFFSGIAISVEGPFKIGEWIKVDDVAGKVVEINWRSTRLVTLDDTTIVIPNSTLAQKMVVNHEQPHGYFRTSVEIALEYGVPIPEAKRVLLAGIRTAKGVMDTPAPDVITTGFGADGIEYKLRWYVPTYKGMMRTRDQVITNVNDALWRAGIGVPYPKRDVFFAPMPPREIDRERQKDIILARNELFARLLPEEITKLAQGLVERKLLGGDVVVKHGDQGDSLYVIVDGLLNVLVNIDGQDRQVAQLRAGQYFGEMSLLTGAPRSATVKADDDGTVYEISKDVLAPLLEGRPKIAEHLSEIVAQRQRELKRISEQDSQSSQSGQDADSGLATQLLGQIRRFFGLRM